MNKMINNYGSSTFKRAVAFTLAETLIVIGIIGIVSALTLPNLNNSTGQKEKVAKVKKIYQNLNDAFGRAEAVYGPYGQWFINDGTNDEAKAKRAGERMADFMKVSKDCGTTATGCFTSGNSKPISGTDSIGTFDSDNKCYRILSADGTSIAISPKYGKIYVDIDGPTKGKYTAGHDIFSFDIDEEKGIRPTGEESSFLGLGNSLYSGDGLNASAWMIKYDNADYLQIKKATRSSIVCNNDNEMTETNPTCK